MIKYLTPITTTLAAALLLTTGSVYASPIVTSNQAVTACKAHFKENVDGYKRAKVADVRDSRANHKIMFRVISDTGNAKTKCVINKDDGSIVLFN